MGKSMFDFGNQGKERARQQKQMAKASKRLIAKQQKANIEAGTPNANTALIEPSSTEEIVKIQA
jgi:hypothetical protein